jgi:steroid 5-alpha reductase family enzyme
MQAERNAFLGIVVALVAGVLIALAGSQGSTSVRGVPVFALCVALAFIIQWVAFIPAFVRQTERYFDITGSATYVVVVAVATLLSPPLDGRVTLLLTCIVMWAARLGTFLFRRIKAARSDSRFDEIKPSFLRFLGTWTLQGLWVSLTAAAALAAITSLARAIEVPGPTILGLDSAMLAGGLIWVAGFWIEAAADLQKSRFRADPANRDRFITTGLWAWSRHPNYFGEVVLWTGIAVIALPVLQGWQYATLISPVFVYLLLTRASGIPLLEKKADATWGGQAEYEAYKAATSVLIPLPPQSW